MAEEDEIDVLGDFNLDNLLSKNEREMYGIDQPQWSFENASNHPSNWYHSTNPDYYSTENIEVDINKTENDSVNEFDNNDINVEEKKDAFGWTDNEKQLFEKAMEIFGRSSVRISQFIGSKTPAEVKLYLKSYPSIKAYSTLTNLYSETTDLSTEPNLLDLNTSEVIVESQIPASIEEVIAAVSTAQPTVKNTNNRKIQKVLHKKKIKYNSNVNFSNIPSGCSLLKKSYMKKQNDEVNEHKKRMINKKRFIYNPTFKKKSKFKYRSMEVKQEIKIEPGNFQLVTGKGLAVPLSTGEEIIKIKRKTPDHESDSDVDIDVDDENDLKKTEIKEETEITNNDEITKDETYIKLEPENSLISASTETSKIDKQINEDLNLIKLESIGNMNEELFEKLSNNNVPTEELQIDHGLITNEEKYIHSEFFEGRPSKTPERYMKIRNHILNSWYMSKPTYVTKTSIRSGLKNCGDVNCIGRVHQYLEQIGAINFGCPQTQYQRPLWFMVFNQVPNTSQNKSKVKKEDVDIQQLKLDQIRPRHKKKFLVDGEGGYTLTHNENGEIIGTTIVNQDTNPKPRVVKKQSIKLMYCKNFSDDYLPPYQVKLHISALLSMDWHAHTTHSEVMGLLGGSYNHRHNTLHITKYVACRSADNSATHCDMCPVSQTEASETLQSENLDVIGWFHSHPTFSPNPSQQDIDTQMNMQEWFSNTKTHNPFVGLILSPFCAGSVSLVSDYRCLIVSKIYNKDGTIKGTPYKFNIEVTSYGLNVNQLMTNASKILSMNVSSSGRIDFEKAYFQDSTITYFEKMISSTKIHLAKCADINKMTCDSIVQGITDLCHQK